MNETAQVSTVSQTKKPRKVKIANLTQAQVAEALSKSGGLFSPAAQLIGCERTTVNKWVERTPALQTLCAKIKEQTIDLAEHRLMQKIGEGNMTAIIFYLKCQAKARGYVERQEMSGPNGGPMQQQIAWVDVDKHRSRLLEAERLEAERAAAGSA